jgi:hypothetical protein
MPEIKSLKNYHFASNAYPGGMSSKAANQLMDKWFQAAATMAASGYVSPLSGCFGAPYSNLGVGNYLGAGAPSEAFHGLSMHEIADAVGNPLGPLGGAFAPATARANDLSAANAFTPAEAIPAFELVSAGDLPAANAFTPAENIPPSKLVPASDLPTTTDVTANAGFSSPDSAAASPSGTNPEHPLGGLFSSPDSAAASPKGSSPDNPRAGGDSTPSNSGEASSPMGPAGSAPGSDGPKAGDSPSIGNASGGEGTA